MNNCRFRLFLCTQSVHGCQGDDATFEMGDTARARVRRRPPTASKMISPKRNLTPTPAQIYTSIQKLEISQVIFTQKEPRTENFTSWFSVNDCEALLRRGNTLIMKIVLSSALSGRYTISLTFVPSYRPRDRFGQFCAKGVAKNKSDLWLSIEIPPNFPVGKYNPHMSIVLEANDDILTHFHPKFIIVLFNPWNTGTPPSPPLPSPSSLASYSVYCSGDDAYVENEAVIRECLTDDVGTIWRGTHRQMTPLLWEYGQVGVHKGEGLAAWTHLSIFPRSTKRAVWKRHCRYCKPSLQTSVVQRPQSAELSSPG